MADVGLSKMRGCAVRESEEQRRVTIWNLAFCYFWLWSSVLLVAGAAALLLLVYFNQKVTISDFTRDYIRTKVHLNNPPITSSFFYGTLPERIRRVRSKTDLAARTIWIYAETRYENVETTLDAWRRAGFLTAEVRPEDRFWLFRAPAWFPAEAELDALYVGRLNMPSTGDIIFPADVYLAKDKNRLYFVMKDGGAHRKDDFLRSKRQDIKSQRLYPPAAESTKPAHQV